MRHDGREVNKVNGVNRVLVNKVNFEIDQRHGPSPQPIRPRGQHPAVRTGWPPRQGHDAAGVVRCRQDRALESAPRPRGAARIRSYRPFLCLSRRLTSSEHSRGSLKLREIWVNSLDLIPLPPCFQSPSCSDCGDSNVTQITDSQRRIGTIPELRGRDASPGIGGPMDSVTLVAWAFGACRSESGSIH